MRQQKLPRVASCYNKTSLFYTASVAHHPQTYRQKSQKDCRISSSSLKCHPHFLPNCVIARHVPRLSHITYASSTEPVEVNTDATSDAAGNQEATPAENEAGADQGSLQPEQKPAAATWFDELNDTQRYVYADEWSFSAVGTSLPAGIPAVVLTQALPDAVLNVDNKKALLGAALPLATMMVGYAWMIYMHSIIPGWQLFLCWCLVGTGYFGLFQIANDCSRGALLPENLSTQDALATLIMAPALYSMHAWRVRQYEHMHLVNQLGEDTALHPITLEDVREANGAQKLWMRALTTTPLKFILSSITHWLQTMQGWDLFTYYHELRQSVIQGWAAPAAFVGLVLPLLMTCTGGLSGLVTYWLGPWLVFHFWQSTFMVFQHTAPHIPWFPAGQHDVARSVISGTVTIPLPSWLEKLLNYANYHIPQHLIYDGVPFYHAKEATNVLRARLWPYMQEASFSLKLFCNHIFKWQVYDETQHQYITFDEAEERIAQETGNATSTDAAATSAALV